MLATIMRNQKAAKHFSKASREQTTDLSAPAETLADEVAKAHNDTDNIINTIRNLQNTMPELAERLERVIPVAV